MTITTRRGLLQATAAAGVVAMVPRLALGQATSDVLELAAERTTLPLYPGVPSELWTYNGVAPGPEIRVRKGERVKVRLTNRLDEPTSIHWHGIRIDNAMDGVPDLTQAPVPPGGTFDYDFVAPDAGTFWYHAHTRSWDQVARGLYGPLIVEEDEPVFDREHDLTLVFDDWRLDGSDALDTASLGSLAEWAHGGRLGNWLTVNGTSVPEYTLRAGEAYRLRLVNAANARIMAFDPDSFGGLVLAYDGQAVPEPARLGYAPLLLGPAQRVDLLVRPGRGGSFSIAEVSGGAGVEAVRFVVEGDATASQDLVRLVPNAIPEPDLEKARQVRLDMRGGAMADIGDAVHKGEPLVGEAFRRTRQVWAFNGVANLAEEPLFSAAGGESIVVEVHNATVFPHAMHVHGHHFRVVERSGSTVDEGAPWRDTFLIGPRQTTKIAFVADNPGKWLLHCHMLEHAAAGMTTWFEVV
ncbi:multicopper oxidase family protein [Lutibaculum baratangense]|uniref:Multicopper oxidase n=1 Tax=Lutibaculum baratangense AMV1 TaxID=631454 RepID=V4RL84_9HYPH|nr:multicopper oxidase family protein [Lutibaculum baratangense]ESR23980.1 Multicopper oxidase [Lutibaculum baratangense AMV1]